MRKIPVMEGNQTRLRRLTRAVVYAVAVAFPIALIAYLVRTQFGPLIDLDQEVSVAATDLTITVRVLPRLATPWNGRIYFDLLALH